MFKMRKIQKTALTTVTAIALTVLVHHHTATAATDNAAKAENPTIAIVNGQEIKRSELVALSKAIAMPPGMTTEQMFPELIDKMIDEKLILSAIKKSKLDQDPDVKKQIENAKQQIIQAAYLEREVRKNTSDKDIKEAYKEFKKQFNARFKDVEETNARHILLKTEDEAKEMIKKLDEGADFATLAKEHSIGPSKTVGGDLLYFTKEQMVPEFSEAAFSMKPGTYSKTPVKTKFGWHVIKVEDRRKKPAPKLEEIKETLIGQLAPKTIESHIKSLRKKAEIKRFSLKGEPLN